MTELAVLTRQAQISDARALAVTYTEAWREAYAGIIPGQTLELMIARRGEPWWSNALSRGQRYLVLDVNGDLAGYSCHGPARWSRKARIGEITELYLKPVYQGIGFGSRLFAEAVTDLRARGYKSCYVRALCDNERALVFYERLGGIIAGRAWERLGGRRLRTVIYKWELD